jgi:hypothetical protein
MLHKLHQPLVADVVEEASNVRSDDPVHLAPANTHKQGIQGLVTATSRTIAVTEPQKVLFVDTFQYRARCLLNDLVLQGSYSQRPHPALWLGDVAPLGRLGSVCSAMDSPVQIIDPPLETLRVVSPRLTVDSWRGLPLQFEKARSQKLRREVVQQAGELLLPRPACRSTYTQQSARPGSERFPVLLPALCPAQ